MADSADLPETGSPQTAAAAEPAAEDRRAARERTRLARSARRFAEAHGGSAEGQIAYLGARGHRLVLVGADGAWGDLVASDRALAEAAAREAGVELREEFDGEMAAGVVTGPYEWSRMAGSQLGGPAEGPGHPGATADPARDAG
ncbi:hypothetical protein [Streptomyces lonarensis]|uniref:Uncharacterized protein n=1 Tax=Streptomyces lonarensis TaxID=700599 RepID=A0A7X6D5Q6_9ACTN|nr:hypothetical protein [Streptomyces lonarensis]NJQ08672.1 hypothetical protein [Streptomyces lonarensis]